MDSNDIDASEIVAPLRGVTEQVPEPPTQAVPIHPFAAFFPMLEGEELDDLVDDIRENGLRDPIVLDTAGQLIDGQNRLKACQLAGVEPTFTTVDTEPIAYILSKNVIRRHFSQGQKAMAIARVYPEPPTHKERGAGKKASVKITDGITASDLTHARFVLRHAPDLVEKVMKRVSSLSDAYASAMTRKREDDEYEQDRKQTQDGVEIIVAIGAQLTSKIEKWETAFLNQEAFVRQVHADAKAIIEHATKLTKI